MQKFRLLNQKAFISLKILESLRKPFSCKANLAVLQIDQINKCSRCWKNKLLPGGCSCVVGHGTGKHLMSLMNIGTVTSRGEQSSGGKILRPCRCLVSTWVEVSSSEGQNLFRLFRSLWQVYGKNFIMFLKVSSPSFWAVDVVAQDWAVGTFTCSQVIRTRGGGSRLSFWFQYVLKYEWERGGGRGGVGLKIQSFYSQFLDGFAHSVHFIMRYANCFFWERSSGLGACTRSVLDLTQGSLPLCSIGAKAWSKNLQSDPLITQSHPKFR